MTCRTLLNILIRDYFRDRVRPSTFLRYNCKWRGYIRGWGQYRIPDWSSRRTWWNLYFWEGLWWYQKQSGHKNNIFRWKNTEKHWPSRKNIFYWYQCRNSDKKALFRSDRKDFDSCWTSFNKKSKDLENMGFFGSERYPFNNGGLTGIPSSQADSLTGTSLAD